MARSTTEEGFVATTPKKTGVTSRTPTKAAPAKTAAGKRAINGAGSPAARRPRGAGRTGSATTDTLIDDQYEGEDQAGADEQGPPVTYEEPNYSSRPPVRSPRRMLAVLGALVAVLFVAALIVLVDKNGAQNAASARRAEVLAAAQKYGVYLSSYSYKNLTGNGSDWKLVSANATASFNHDFSQTSGSLGQLLRQYNATATGKVVAAGISSVTTSKAVVLLFIDQTVTNSANKSSTPQTQPLRVLLTMVHQHGRWLIDSLQLPN
jgi:Mce-associated membrane protein